MQHTKHTGHIVLTHHGATTTRCIPNTSSQQSVGLEVTRDSTWIAVVGGLPQKKGEPHAQFQNRRQQDSP
eukprot:4673966-Amphidinium_carterae.1